MVEIPLETDWLLQDDKRIVVRTPDINSILGDKLTAFAPNTTGIPYKAQKEKEKWWKETWKDFYPNMPNGYLLIKVKRMC